MTSKLLISVILANLAVLPVYANAKTTHQKPKTHQVKKAKRLTQKQLDVCVDKWVSAYRADVGEEQFISQDQINEWEDWCKQGKRPH